MVKVKVEKKMNLLELLKWAQENDITNRIFFGHGITFVSIDCFGLIKCVGVNPEHIFTVNDEKEITEDTKIDNLVEIVINDKNIPHTAVFYNTSINERLSITRYRPQVFYMLNDDSTITRIWENGKLVD